MMVTPAPARVRRALADAPISLRELASLANVEPSLVRKAAAGERTLTPSLALELAGALDQVGARAAACASALREYASNTRP